MKNVLIILFLILSVNIYAEDLFTLYLDRSRLQEISEFEFLPETISEDMLIHLPNISGTQSNYTLLRMSGSVYALRDGMFDVLVWQDTNWVNLYGESYSGYNFGTKFFTMDNMLYSIGGYGYWHSHSNLIRFDKELGYWKMIPTINKPQNYTSYCVGQIGDTLLSLFGEFRDESINYNANAKNGYYLNMKSLVWNEISYDNNVQKIGSLIIGNKYLDLHDYIVFEKNFETQLGLYIINKTNFTVSFWNRGEFTINFSPFVFIENNNVTFQTRANEQLTINFEKKWNDDEVILGQISFNTSNGFPIFWFVGILCMLLILSPLSYFTMKYFKTNRIINNGSNSSDDFIEHLTLRMLTKKGEIIDTDAINQLLEIDNLTYENRRVKRSKLINDINSRYRAVTGNDLIIRKRDVEDKRYVKYEIGINNK